MYASDSPGCPLWTSWKSLIWHKKLIPFDISIQPFEDCCTIFAPDRPKTNPKIKNVEQYERRMDVDALVERAVAGIW